MNCKQGDIAIIKTTHPLQRLHGRLVECVRFEGAIDSEIDVWFFKFAGGPQVSDQGVPQPDGYIQDRHLRPIRPGPISESIESREEITA